MTAPIARLYLKGTGTSGDTLIDEKPIDDPDFATMLNKAGPTQYVVVQAAGDGAKSIDNW